MTDWTLPDSEQLRAYLVASKGKLLENLRAAAPKIDAKSFEEVALQAKLQTGWNDCIKTIEANAEPRPERTESAPFQDITVGEPK